MTSLAVAVAQLSCHDDDLAANVGTHLALIAQAHRAKVDLLLFPELSLTGYAGGATAAQRGQLPGGAILRRLTAACGGMAVSVGLPEMDAAGLLYNTQVLLRDGAILHRHRKVNLPTYGRLEEGKCFTAGRIVEPVYLGAWSVATLICADTWNPALPWLAALSGADLLLVPVASGHDAVGGGFDQPAGWDINLRHTALTYGMPVMMANHSGSGDFWGESRILNARGREVARAGEQSGLSLARLELPDVRAARRLLPTMRDADPDLIEDELHRRLALRGAAVTPSDISQGARL
jgi:predicted amidohydrolase